MRNPNRSTKPERRAVRASNPTVCRAMGIAAAVRLQRQRSMRPEAEQLDRFTRAMGLETLMSESPDPDVNHWSTHGPDVDALAARAGQITDALAEQYRNWLLNGEMTSPSGRFRAVRNWAGGAKIIDEEHAIPDINLGPEPPIAPGSVLGRMRGHNPGFTIIDEPNPDDVPYPTAESVTVEPDGWITLKYAPHISRGLLDRVEAAAAAAAPDFRQWWSAPEPEQPTAIGTEHLHKNVAEFQRTILPDLIAHPNDDTEES